MSTKREMTQGLEPKKRQRSEKKAQATPTNETLDEQIHKHVDRLLKATSKSPDLTCFATTNEKDSVVAACKFTGLQAKWKASAVAAFMETLASLEIEKDYTYDDVWDILKTAMGDNCSFFHEWDDDVMDNGEDSDSDTITDK